jgi:hypothetical protein
MICWLGVARIPRHQGHNRRHSRQPGVSGASVGGSANTRPLRRQDQQTPRLNSRPLLARGSARGICYMVFPQRKFLSIGGLHPSRERLPNLASGSYQYKRVPTVVELHVEGAPTIHILLERRRTR